MSAPLDLIADVVGRIVAREREAWKKDHELAMAEQKLAMAELKNELLLERSRLHEATERNAQRLTDALTEIRSKVAELDEGVFTRVNSALQQFTDTFASKDEILRVDQVRAVSNEAAAAALDNCHPADASQISALIECVSGAAAKIRELEIQIQEHRPEATKAEVKWIVDGTARELGSAISALKIELEERIAQAPRTFFVSDDRVKQLVDEALAASTQAGDLSKPITEVEVKGIIDSALTDVPTQHSLEALRAEVEERVAQLPRPEVTRADIITEDRIKEIVNCAVIPSVDLTLIEERLAQLPPQVTHEDLITEERVQALIDQAVAAIRAALPEPAIQIDVPAVVKTLIEDRIAQLPPLPDMAHVAVTAARIVEGSQAKRLSDFRVEIAEAISQSDEKIAAHITDVVEERIARLPSPPDPIDIVDQLTEIARDATRDDIDAMRRVVTEALTKSDEQFAKEIADLSDAIAKQPSVESIRGVVDEQLQELTVEVLPQEWRPEDFEEYFAAWAEPLVTRDELNQVAGAIGALTLLPLPQSDDEIATIADARVAAAIAALPPPLQPRNDEEIIGIVTEVLRAATPDQWTPERAISGEAVEQMISDRLARVPPAPVDRAVIEEIVAEQIPILTSYLDRTVHDEVVRSLPEPAETLDPAAIEQMISDRLARVPPAPVDRAAIEEIVAEQIPILTSYLDRTVHDEVVRSLPEPAETLDPAAIEQMISDRLAIIRSFVDEAIANLPQPETPRTDDEIAEIVRPIVSDYVKENLPEIDRTMIEGLIETRIAAMPTPLPPEVDPSVVEAAVAAQVALLPPPERGDPGPPGKFPIPTEWKRGSVSYESEVKTHHGSTWCAIHDTAEEPGHADWILVAAAGTPAAEPYVGEVRGLYSPTQSYRKFDVVAFNSSEWRAKCDDPGPLPGPDWALGATQGKTGRPGPKGDRGAKGDQGTSPPPPPTMRQWLVKDFAVASLMADDTAGPELDLRPLFERYHDEVSR